MSYAGQLAFIANVLLIAGIGLLLLVAVWAIRGTVPRSVRSKYPKRLMNMAQLPFTEEWRRHVNPEDLPLIVRARRRRFVFLLAMLVLTHLMAAHAYVHAVVQLYCCQIAALGRPDPACNRAAGRAVK